MTHLPPITYIGHSTVLIEMDGVRLLTDPALRDRLAHLRRVGGAIDATHCAEPDAVLISHLHWDHTDLPSLRLLGRQTRLIVPVGAARLLEAIGFTRVEELPSGASTFVGSVEITASAVSHSGFRPPFGPEAEALAFLIRGSHHIYFVGDTELHEDMHDGDPLDLALLPVWGWGPWLRGGHLTPEHAAEALTHLQPRHAIPIHWGTFYPLGMGWLRPRFLRRPPRLFRTLARAVAPEVSVHILRPGEGTDGRAPEE